MPGPKPRLHLPFTQWPSADRRLWDQAFCQDDPFSDMHLSEASQGGCLWAWRRLLGFLKNNEPEALEIPPVERLTRGRVRALAVHLAETNTPLSVAALVERLYTAARFLMPDHDWIWLKRIKSRLHRAVPAHSPKGP
jgi:hypothetical protein